MHHLRPRWPTPALVVSIVALVVALGGVAYATDPEPPGFGHNTGHAAAGKGTECTLGEVLLTAGNVANGMPANGELLQIRQHLALFALLGTTYGGDGKTTFALPNLRSVTPNHMTYSICDHGHFPHRR
jgi:Phage Tail Collar Domain